VIPSLATLVVIVVGANALGGTIGEVCHRPERVAALAGRSVDDVLLPQDVVTVVAHPEGGLKGIPEGARVAVALTRATREEAAEIVSLLGRLPQFERVVALEGRIHPA
jgi:probable selenium-dependent hydroxylase accessory protein YqeC